METKSEHWRSNNGIMIRNNIKQILLITVLCSVVTYSGMCCNSAKSAGAENFKTDPLEAVLNSLNESIESMETYQAKIEYLFSQPLFDSKSLKKGALYFKRDGNTKVLRINFVTLQQDDEKEEKYTEQYIFDGCWLTIIDYRTKLVKQQQIADANSAADPFEIISRNFPLIGFSKIEKLKEDFDIALVPSADANLPAHHLKMKTRPGSVYKDDYISIDFRIDKKLNLPVKIVAVSTENDIYEISFKKVVVNKKIDKKIFKIKVPRGFEKEIIPLKDKKKG